MTDGEVHETSRLLGELISEVKSLAKSTDAIHRRLDEHIRDDNEDRGILKMAVEKIGMLSEEQKKTAAKVADHETLKNKAIGYSLAASAGVSGGLAWMANFFKGAQ